MFRHDSSQTVKDNGLFNFSSIIIICYSACHDAIPLSVFLTIARFICCFCTGFFKDLLAKKRNDFLTPVPSPLSHVILCVSLTEEKNSFKKVKLFDQNISKSRGKFGFEFGRVFLIMES